MNEPIVLQRKLPALVLASGSPRRKQLLEQMGLCFDVVVRDVKESVPSRLPPRDGVLEIAHQKMQTYDDLTQESLVLCADTVVAIEEDILGKPENRQEAIVMLQRLRSTTHRVLTAVLLRYKARDVPVVEVTEVEFGPLSDWEIESYVDTGAPFDKAGGYGIQDWIGKIGVTALRGSYDNVVGLPCAQVWRALSSFDGL